MLARSRERSFEQNALFACEQSGHGVALLHARRIIPGAIRRSENRDAGVERARQIVDPPRLVPHEAGLVPPARIEIVELRCVPRSDAAKHELRLAVCVIIDRRSQEIGSGDDERRPSCATVRERRNGRRVRRKSVRSRARTREDTSACRRRSRTRPGARRAIVTRRGGEATSQRSRPVTRSGPMRPARTA